MRRDLTPEERAAHGAKIRAGWAKKSPADREAFRASCRAARAARRERLAAGGVPTPARAVKGSRDALATAAESPLGAAVREEAARMGGRLAELASSARGGLVAPGTDGGAMPARPAWTDTSGAPAEVARTNGDLGRHLGALIDAAAGRIADQVATRLTSKLAAATVGVSPAPPPASELGALPVATVLALVRDAVTLAHATQRPGTYAAAVSRVRALALVLEPHLPREPRS